jgi:hypothetical protein
MKAFRIECGWMLYLPALESSETKILQRTVN